ncbi:MAG: TIGR03620 family F420-dependent LLM class oxidoreductase [Chloroflexota bacterium]
MQGGAATLGAAYPGRFVLGLGISHAPAVERSGQAYVKPLQHMARYLHAMDAAVAAAPATEVPAPRVLAALRPNMLALARDRADGAHPYFVPVAHTPIARAALGSDKLLIPEQAVVVNTDPDEARGIARDHMRGYLTLPNYVNNLRHLGYTDADVSAGGSDRLVDAIVAWGDEANIARRVREHLDGGADHVLLQPLGDLEAALRQLERLAPAVLSN